jgi:hypothetical protein
LAELVYHGTSTKHLADILMNGIQPREKHECTNWEHTVESHSEMVYLTDIYAGYFASCSIKNGEDDKVVVIEVDMEKLPYFNFYPDEDYIAQSISHSGNNAMDRFCGKADATLHDVTKYVRENIEDFRQNWLNSYQDMGTFAYKGTIPLDAITRIAIWDQTTNTFLSLAMIDPTITPLNHMVCKNKYSMITRWLMGEKISADEYIDDFSKPYIDLSKVQTMLDMQKVNVLNMNSLAGTLIKNAPKDFLQSYINGEEGATWAPEWESERIPVSTDDGFYSVSYSPGLMVTDIGLMLIVYSTDEGGSELEEACDVFNQSSVESIADTYFSYEKFQKAINEYADWVAKTGLDPLNEFIIERNKDVTWKVNVNIDWGNKLVEFISATREDTGKVYKIQGLNSEVKSFLCLKKKGKKWYIALDKLTFDEIINADNVKWSEKPTSEQPAKEYTIKFTLSMPLTKEVIRKKIKQQAEKYVQNYQKNPLTSL